MHTTVLRYATHDGVDVFQRWLDGLGDRRAYARVSARLDRVMAGNMGDYKHLRDGVFEFRIDYGPGYRVYFGFVGHRMILLTGGGTKKTQTADINAAVEYLEDYKRREP
jgi:putative addiction module killer protein